MKSRIRHTGCIVRLVPQLILSLTLLMVSALSPLRAVAGSGCPDISATSGVTITLEGDHFERSAKIKFAVTGIKPVHVSVPNFSAVYVSFTKTNQPNYTEYANVQKTTKAGDYSGTIYGPHRDGVYDMKVFIVASYAKDTILAQTTFAVGAATMPVDSGRPLPPAEPPPASSSASQSPAKAAGLAALIGDWTLGSLSGALYDRGTGIYKTWSGIGGMHSYQDDGKFFLVTIFQSVGGRYQQVISGKYTASSNTINCTDVSIFVDDNGKQSKESMANFSFNYRLGEDKDGRYLMHNYNADGPRDPITAASSKMRYSKPSASGSTQSAQASAPSADSSMETKLLGTWRNMRNHDDGKPYRKTEYTFMANGNFETTETHYPYDSKEKPTVKTSTGVRYRVQTNPAGNLQVWFYAPDDSRHDYYDTFKYVSANKILLDDYEYSKISGPTATAKPASAPGTGTWAYNNSVGNPLRLTGWFRIKNVITLAADGKFTLTRGTLGNMVASMHTHRGSYRVNGDQLECYNVEQAAFSSSDKKYGPHLVFDDYYAEHLAMLKDFKPYKNYTWTWALNTDGSLLLTGGDKDSADTVYKKDPSAKLATTNAPASTTTSSSSATSAAQLTGKWQHVNNVYINATQFKKMFIDVTFNTDGTYSRITNSSGSNIAKETFLETGSYSAVSSGKIQFTNAKETHFYGNEAPKYTNKSKPNYSESYQFLNNSEKLKIGTLEFSKIAIPSAQSETSSPQSVKNITGVWMSIYNGNRTSSVPSYRYMVFYDDGTFYQNMPENGFIGFDKKASQKEKKDYWGTYTFSGTSGKWKFNSNSGGGDPLTLKANGSLDLGTTLYLPFYRCVSVDGLRLKGSWTSHGTLDDWKSGPGKPLIHFSTDGTFNDEGLFRWSLASTESEKSNAPGKGKYEIKDYTIILKYSDGRTRQTSFNLGYGASVEQSPDLIFMTGNYLNQLTAGKIPSSQTTDTPRINEPRLVGAWSTHPLTAIKDSNEWIEFKSDGTFIYQLANRGTIRPFVDIGTVLIKGACNIKGGKIYCTQVLYSYLPLTGNQSKAYTDKPGKDLVWAYQFSHVGWGTDPKWTELDWLEININTESSGATKDYKKFVKPLQPESPNATNPAGTSTQPSQPGTADSKLVGKWEDSAFSGSVGRQSTLVFSDDGTFEQADTYIVDGVFYSSVVKTWTGNYKRSGSGLTFSKRIYNESTSHDSSVPVKPVIQNAPAKDETWTISLQGGDSIKVTRPITTDGKTKGTDFIYKRADASTPGRAKPPAEPPATDLDKLFGTWDYQKSVGYSPNAIRNNEILTLNPDGTFIFYRTIRTNSRGTISSQRGAYRVSGNKLECRGVEESYMSAPGGEYGGHMSFENAFAALDSLKKEYKPYKDYSWTFVSNKDGSLLLNGGDKNGTAQIFTKSNRAWPELPQQTDNPPEPVPPAPDTEKIFGAWTWDNTRESGEPPPEQIVLIMTFVPQGKFALSRIIYTKSKSYLYEQKGAFRITGNTIECFDVQQHAVDATSGTLITAAQFEKKHAELMAKKKVFKPFKDYSWTWDYNANDTLRLDGGDTGAGDLVCKRIVVPGLPTAADYAAAAQKPPPSDKPAASTTGGGNAAPGLVGAWHIAFGADKYGLPARKFEKEYKADGTYLQTYIEDGSNILKETITQTGRYRIASGKIYYSSIKSTKQRGPNVEYKDKSMTDYSETFSLYRDKDNDQWLKAGDLDLRRKDSGASTPAQPAATNTSADTAKLVGDWEARWSGVMGAKDSFFYDTRRFSETYIDYWGEGLHFYKGGTFMYAIGTPVINRTSQAVQINGVTIIRGKYRAEAGKLYMTNQRSSYIPRANDPSRKAKYTNRAEKDAVWTYAFASDHVVINTDPADKTGVSKQQYYDMRLHPRREANTQPAQSSTPAQTSAPSQTTTAKTDPKLSAGEWTLTSTGIAASQEYYGDGTFMFVTVANQSGSSYKYSYTTSGKYTVASGGVIKCSGVTYTSRTFYKSTGLLKDEKKSPRDDFTFNYAVGTDKEGPYLQENYNADGTRKPIASDSVKWRLSPSAPSQPKQPAPAATTTATLTGDSAKLVGDWESSWTGSRGQKDSWFYDTRNLSETKTDWHGEGLHFYKDGTFKYANGSAVLAGLNRVLLLNGVSLIRGNFRAEGGKLYITNQRSSYIPRANDPSGKEKVIDRPEPDEVWSYSFDSEHVVIDKYPNDTKNSRKEKYYDMRKFQRKEMK